MDSKITEDKNRTNKSDLIDLSSSIENTTSGQLLDLFDPLCDSKPQKTLVTSQNGPSICRVRPTSKRSSQLLTLSRKDRRNTNTSIISVSVVPSKDESIVTSTTDDLKDVLDSKSFQETGDNSSKLKLVRKHQRSSRELCSLTQKIKSFRSKFKHDDIKTNAGLVYSQTLYSSRVRDMSVKIIMTSPMASSPINFTCNASTTVEHLISHSVCSMFDNITENDNMENYMLKVTGKDEYFDPKLCLADYAHVSHCWKFDLDVKLTLVAKKDAKRPFLRESQDDFHCSSRLCADDLLSRRTIINFSDLNYESLSIMVETFDREAHRLYDDVTKRSSSIQTQKLLQATKAICSHMMNCETSQLTESKNNFVEICRYYKNEGQDLKDEDRYKMIEVIQHAIKKLVQDMHRLLRVFSIHLPVDYEVLELVRAKTRDSFVDSPSNTLRDQISLRVQVLSQLKPEWLQRYREFHLRLGLVHGTTTVCPDVATTTVRVDSSLFPRLLFDQDLVLSVTYSDAPRESLFVLTLFGVSANQLTVPTNDDNFRGSIRRAVSSSSISSTTPVYISSPNNATVQRSSSEPIQTALASTVAYLFDYDLNLKQGDCILCMHPIDDNSTEHTYSETVSNRQDPVLLVELKTFPPEKKIYFPSYAQTQATKQTLADKLKALDFDQLDSDTKHKLKSIIYDKQVHEKLSEHEKAQLWDYRLYLTLIPAALPKLLLAVPSWSANCLGHIYELVECWKSLEPVDAMQLLLPSMPDSFIRKKAVDLIAEQNDDELSDYLPQLLQAFRYEKTLDCPLFWLLIERALKSTRIANLAYWQLKLNSLDPLFQERCEILINCLQWLCGSAFWKSVDKQCELLHLLSNVSSEVKKTRDSHRMDTLMKCLEQVQDYLNNKKPTVPWAISLEVCDLELANCSYFPSNTLPLKLAFRSCERSCNGVVKFHTYPAIFKEGDDLRQDMLAIQMIRIMEKLWLREGLDLRIVTFDCLATDERQGMVEMVQNAETLRKIHQNSSFLTGSFNAKAIDNYIRLWNTSELEYKTAVDKFLHSCAGYAVATYILGICDRHNDNIMVTTSGHLFHIDFGKFLGDAQMLGSIKRDRTPFVLTSDMAYVINGGDRPSKKFQTFIELCAMAFNIIRRNRNIFLNLFALMSSAKINGLNGDSVNYINKMLMPQVTEIEAMAKFTRLIEDCLSSRSTQVNFFIHNLAQLKFSSDSNKQSLLSFVPKTFTMQTDGKIESIDILNFFKIYEPEKQYYYRVRVKRQSQPDPIEVIRTFREFSEFQLKLNSMFPDYIFHDINKSSSNSFPMDLMVRNTREVAERRLGELRTFLAKLKSLPTDIFHCDLIYTFFHPILRDQQQSSNNLDISITSESSTFGFQEITDAQRAALYVGANGQVKLSMSYKNFSLIIMIMHAKNLACPDASVVPNCYAKTYLLPDPNKQTKKKTRVVRQSNHPSFMELIVYKIPLECLKSLTLQVSIWHSELVHNKVFLGAATIPLNSIDLSKETTSWYPLKNF